MENDLVRLYAYICKLLYKMFDISISCILIIAKYLCATVLN